VNSQTQAAQTQQTALQDRLARLKTYSKESAEFEALSQRLTAAVPVTSDVYDYITALSNAAAATGVDVSSVSPSSPVTGGNVAVVPVSLSVSGSYDQTLAFIKALYALPRLTIHHAGEPHWRGNGDCPFDRANQRISASISSPNLCAGRINSDDDRLTRDHPFRFDPNKVAARVLGVALVGILAAACGSGGGSR